MKILKGGIFAKNYGSPTNLHTTYHWYEISSSLTLEWWKEQGYTFVCRSDISFEELSHEELIKGEVEALKAQQRAKRAESEKDCTEIQRRINELLALEYIPAEQPRGEFAPRRTTDDVSDVDTL